MILTGEMWELTSPALGDDTYIKLYLTKNAYTVYVTVEELRDIVFLAESFFQEREKANE